MATSAIGPGFLTQTGQFTGNLKGSFGFVILISVILAAIVQLNVWRVLCVSGMRGQDVANKVLPGLGYVIAFLVVAGGLVFNIGNVGGGASDSTPCLASRYIWLLPRRSNRDLCIPLQKCIRCNGHTDKNSWWYHDCRYFCCHPDCKTTSRNGCQGNICTNCSYGQYLPCNSDTSWRKLLADTSHLPVHIV